MSKLALLGSGLATPGAGGGDVTAPVITGPLTFAETGVGQGTVGANTDTNEGAFYGVLSDLATAGTADQIIGGLKSTGVAALATFTQAPGGTGVRAIAVTGWTPADALYIHLTQTDTAGNKATSVSYGPFNLTPAIKAVQTKLNASLTSQNFTSITAIAWSGGDILDTDAFHDPASNNTRVVIPSGVSRIQLFGQVGIQNATSGETLEITIRKNGSAITTVQVNTNMSEASTINTGQFVSWPMNCVATDYYEVQVTVQADTAVDLLVSRTWFSAMKVS